MKTHHRLLALTTSLLLACTIFAPAASGKSTFSWKDKDGRVQFGDTVPPEYASKGYRELNEQGVTVRVVPPQMSPAEAAAQKKLDDEQKRRKDRDDYLLHSYTKVADIERLRDERIALIESQMELVRANVATNDDQLEALKTRLRNFRPYSSSSTAKRVPDRLASDVVNALSKRRSQLAQLQKYESDKATQQKSFSEDIARYKELTVRN